MTSAANELGIDSHPLTTASPRAQIFFTVFSLTTRSCLFGEGGSAPLSTPPRTRGGRRRPPARLPREPAGRRRRPPLDSPGHHASSGRHTTRKLHHLQILRSSVFSKSAIAPTLAAGSTRYAFIERIERRSCSLMAASRSSLH